LRILHGYLLLITERRSNLVNHILFKGKVLKMSCDNVVPAESTSLTQAFGSLVPVHLGLTQDVRHRSVMALNRLLAHTIALRDLYKKSHWQTSGATFFELHQLFDKHYREQEGLMDEVAERVQTLGGVAMALAKDIAEETRLARGPAGIENSAAQLLRLLNAHELVLLEARPLSSAAAGTGDVGTNDLIVHLVRVNELQSWFLWRQSAIPSLPPQ
jgi:starvation-inducible DNA-binding protein